MTEYNLLLSHSNVHKPMQYLKKTFMSLLTKAVRRMQPINCE